MKVRCPKCHARIATADINVKFNAGLCRKCHEVVLLPQVEASLGLNVNRPPDGCTYRELAGLSGGFAVTASTVSWMVALVIPFACIWCSGIATIGSFIFFPDGPRSAVPHNQSVFGTIFMVAFLTPFVAAGLMMIGVCAVMLWGHVTVSVEGNEGRLFIGVGRFGWARRFAWNEITQVALMAEYNEDGKPSPLGVLVRARGRPLKFGRLLTQQRRDFLLGVLRQRLEER
jgi:hypothetical protein